MSTATNGQRSSTAGVRPRSQSGLAVTTPSRPRVAVVSYLDSYEFSKVAAIIASIRAKGAEAVLFDARLFEQGKAFVTRTDGQPSIVIANGNSTVSRALVNGIVAKTRDIDIKDVETPVDKLLVVTDDRTQRVPGTDSRFVGGSVRYIQGPIAVDAVWADGVDIDRRLGLRQLFIDLRNNYVPTFSPSWESVVLISLKDRAHDQLAKYAARYNEEDELPQPSTVLIRVHNMDYEGPATVKSGRRHLHKNMRVCELDWKDPPARIRRQLEEAFGSDEIDQWYKPVDGTHSWGVNLVTAGEDPLEALASALRLTDDGLVCLGQEDIKTIVHRVDDPDKTPMRADMALTGTRKGLLLATLRTQDKVWLPTNSHHGGVARYIPPETLDPGFEDMLLGAFTAANLRVGGIDVFGGFSEGDVIETRSGMFYVEKSGPGKIGEINLTPGGRGPKYKEGVIDPMVEELFTAIHHDRHGSVYLFGIGATPREQRRIAEELGLKIDDDSEARAVGLPGPRTTIDFEPQLGINLGQIER